MNTVWLVLSGILGGLLSLLGGSASPSTPTGERPVLVVTWSQATSDVADLDQVVGQETLVVDTEADRAALLRRVPDGLSATELEAVDLTTHLLVAGGYHRCTESSSIVLTDDGWVFEVSDGDERVACAWSPYTIDVWAVERPEPRTLVASWSQGDSPDLVQDWRLEPLVIGTDAERDDFVAAAPVGLRDEIAAVVGDVDLDGRIVVAGGYHDCLSSSRVGPGPVLEVVEDEPGAVCDWAPYTVDVHVVAR